MKFGEPVYRKVNPATIQSPGDESDEDEVEESEEEQDEEEDGGSFLGPADLMLRTSVLVRDAKTWAHVDWLATKVLGALLVREPALGKQLDRWAKDKDFWVRRTALLALHDPILQGGGDFDHFARLAVPMLSEREFFIRKAIGWILRSASKRGPERTYAFVKEHARELSGLSFREAVKHLPAAQQRELTALRDA